MGFDIKKAKIKSLLPMVIDFLPMLDQAVEDFKNEWAKKSELLPGEDIVGVLFSQDHKTYITIGILSAENHIRKELTVMLFSDFVMKLISEFKKA